MVVRVPESASKIVAASSPACGDEAAGERSPTHAGSSAARRNLPMYRRVRSGPWPAHGQHPGESVRDWIARLDVLVNIDLGSNDDG
jgi:hypothetical protein